MRLSSTTPSRPRPLWTSPCRGAIPHAAGGGAGEADLPVASRVGAVGEPVEVVVDAVGAVGLGRVAAERATRVGRAGVGASVGLTRVAQWAPVESAVAGSRVGAAVEP